MSRYQHLKHFEIIRANILVVTIMYNTTQSIEKSTERKLNKTQIQTYFYWFTRKGLHTTTIDEKILQVTLKSYAFFVLASVRGELYELIIDCIHAFIYLCANFR